MELKGRFKYIAHSLHNWAEQVSSIKLSLNLVDWVQQVASIKVVPKTEEFLPGVVITLRSDGLWEGAFLPETPPEPFKPQVDTVKGVGTFTSRPDGGFDYEQPLMDKLNARLQIDQIIRDMRCNRH